MTHSLDPADYLTSSNCGSPIDDIDSETIKTSKDVFSTPLLEGWRLILDRFPKVTDGLPTLCINSGIHLERHEPIPGSTDGPHRKINTKGFVYDSYCSQVITSGEAKVLREFREDAPPSVDLGDHNKAGQSVFDRITTRFQ